jgi:hypothetical protein
MPDSTLRKPELPAAKLQVLDNCLCDYPTLIFSDSAAQSLDRCAGQGKSDIEG